MRHYWDYRHYPKPPSYLMFQNTILDSSSIGAYGGKSGYTTKEINKHLFPIQEVLNNLYGMFRQQ